jgi:hypothetical protein
MKVIDLLNKIANNEELPLKIKLEQGVFTLREDCGGNKWYGREYDHKDIFETINQNLEYVLLEEIELIEEKKIELPEELKEILIPSSLSDSDDFRFIFNYINDLIKNQKQIVDYLKYKEEEKKK